MQKKTLNLALSKSKYFYDIPFAVDGYIFDYVEDISETKHLQVIAALRIEDILKAKHLLPKRKWLCLLSFVFFISLFNSQKVPMKQS